ncbi:acyl-CoA dehydrogenase [Aerophototrophica crusticola]|uniref:Acyl-CoA dehydrogenase n=1 Tax=Aerophototrophica crusticola TaxID=1709002 RepID=A0A858R965_9PROT|nr:acyl-CoA dehydrogenase [Rhodospirillaceae bacterium B3]
MSRMDPREIAFLLDEVLEVPGLLDRPRFAHLDRGAIDQVLETAAKLADEKFGPHYHEADKHEPDREGGTGKVVMIPQVKQAVDAFAEAGFLAAHHDEERGGLQLPWTVVQAAFSFFQTANIATAAYPFLTIGAANLIDSFGTEAQKQRYMAHMLTGRFFGTMALSEPQAGSSLADIRTLAVPNEDGSYSITGTKQWISAGEHELSENIVHMVLAKIKGGPVGVKGISLFIVPRYRVNEDGSLGDHNDVRLVSLLHKMGYRGTTSTILAFGEEGRCQGFLLGEPHKGLSYMFQMMNEARIGVGLGAAALGYAGYRYSLEYAKTRPQGRPAHAKDPASPMVPIIEHPDVKRMLLQQKAASEGALALCLLCARLVDEEKTAEEPEARKRAALLLEVLTPIAKSWPSEHCLEANKWAIQILGGYGYTRDYPVEQYYRDNRLNPIHEGTYGIQALDLLGRKAFMQDGAALALLGQEVQGTIKAAAEVPALAGYAAELGKALALVGETTATLGKAMAGGQAAPALANAVAYLELVGHTVLAWTWLRLALAASKALAEGRGDPDHLNGKLAACRYFHAWELPKIRAQAKLLQSLDTTTLETPAAWL